MTKDGTLRPFCLVGMAALTLMNGFSADDDLVRWLGIGTAAFSFTAAGWFFREVWQSKQSGHPQ